MGKRKEDQRRDNPTSSNAKRRRPRHYQNEETSRPNDGIPQEGGFSDVFRDAVIEIIDTIQVKVSTEAKFKRKIEKLKEKRKKDKKKHKEDLRILKEELRILKKSYEDFRVLKEGLRIFKEGHEDLKSKVQEMPKEGCAEVDPYRASTSQRSQLNRSTRFRLVIENRVITPIYKNETLETEDGGGHLRVIMYDGGNPIAPDHPLASAKVDLVVIEGRFNEPKRDSWSKEDFEKSIITPREGMIRLVKNGTFDLIGGSCDHPGAIIMDNSQKKEVKLGVMIAVHTEERVLEGVSNPFKVQEGKTKRSQKKGIQQPAPPVATPMLGQSTSTYSTLQHGQGPASPVRQHSLPPPLQKSGKVINQNFQVHGNHTVFLDNNTAEDYRLSYPPPTVPLMVEGNGQALNGNGQNCSQLFQAQMWGLSTSPYPIDHAQVYSWAPPSIQNQLQVAVSCPVNQPILDHRLDHYTSFTNGSSEYAYQNPPSHVSLNDTQSTFISEGEISVEDVRNSIAQTQMQQTYETYRCGRVLLQWDNVELMPLYSTKSKFYGEIFPSKRLMDKTHKLLGSISPVGSVWKKMTSVTRPAVQTPHKIGVLIQPIEPYDSDDELPFKKRRNARYQLQFVNTVCKEYYTQEKIKSEDGTFLKVALYDENNLVVTSGPMSSASVEVVLLHGDFYAEGQDSWTSEEFSTCLVHPQSAEEPPALGGDRVLELTDGEADLGNVNFQNSSFHARTGKFKMGAVIKNVREHNVQEAITSPFVVRVRLEEDHIHSTILPPAFLDSSIGWNTNHNQVQQLASDNVATTPPAGSSGEGGSNNHPHPLFQFGAMATATGGGGGGGEGDGDGGLNKQMSMLERRQLTPAPQPVLGLKCPRCNSTNTKFCYYNNHSTTQPRYFCAACRCYWTHGGKLRKIPAAPRPRGGPEVARAARALSATSTTPSVEELADSNVD